VLREVILAITVMLLSAADDVRPIDGSAVGSTA
jgi:hypothetical protein